MFQKVQMEISKSGEKKGDKRIKVGDVDVFVPTLKDIAAIVAGAEQKVDEKNQPIFEDGLPVYTTDAADWIQGSILAQVKAQARNKLVTGTVSLKEGQKIPETWEELCAEGTRGPGAGLKLLQDFKRAFSDWVAKQGLSEASGAFLVAMVGNKNALLLQNDSIKGKVSARLTAFAESLSEEDMERFMSPLTAATEACTAGFTPDF